MLPYEEEAKNKDVTNTSSKVTIYSVLEENQTSLLKEAPSLFSERRGARFTNVRLLRSGSGQQFQNYARRLARSTVSAPLVYARRVVASLFREGRRAQRENAVRGTGQPTKARGSSTTARQRRNWFVSGASASSSSPELFRSLPLTLPPFVALRVRRRTKRAAPRIRHLTRLEGQRIALRNLVKAVQRPSRRSRQAGVPISTGGASSSLNSRLLRTLSTLSATSGSSKGASSALRERRQEIHQQARKARPRN